MRARPALTIGVASVAGVGVGAVVAHALPESDLRRLFGVLLSSSRADALVAQVAAARPGVRRSARNRRLSG